MTGLWGLRRILNLIGSRWVQKSIICPSDSADQVWYRWYQNDFRNWINPTMKVITTLFVDHYKHGYNGKPHTEKGLRGIMIFPQKRKFLAFPFFSFRLHCVYILLLSNAFISNDSLAAVNQPRYSWAGSLILYSMVPMWTLSCPVCKSLDHVFDL